jgi:hypothetical protein
MLTRLDDELLDHDKGLALPGRWIAFSDHLPLGRRLSDIPWCIGVYAIYLNISLIYIGMSTVGIGSRLSSHFVRHHSADVAVLWSAHLQTYVRRKDLAVKVRCCRPAIATRLEEAFICRLKPACNKVKFHRGRRGVR